MDLEVGHCLDHDRGRPSHCRAAGNQEGEGIHLRHKAIAVVLNLMDYPFAPRRAIGGGTVSNADEMQNGRNSGPAYSARPSRRIRVPP